MLHRHHLAKLLKLMLALSARLISGILARRFACIQLGRDDGGERGAAPPPPQNNPPRAPAGGGEGEDGEPPSPPPNKKTRRFAPAGSLFALASS